MDRLDIFLRDYSEYLKYKEFHEKQDKGNSEVELPGTDDGGKWY